MEERSVADELDVQRVIYDYAWACDNNDWRLLGSVFASDAHLDYSSTGGPAGGREEVVRWLRESLSQLPVIQHVVSNFQIAVQGDQATGRAMCICPLGGARTARSCWFARLRTGEIQRRHEFRGCLRRNAHAG